MPLCIKIEPTKSISDEETIRSTIKATTVLPMANGCEDMYAEMEYLKSALGWSNPQGLYGYTKDSIYKDLFVYFDHGDTISPINKLATRAFEMYGLGGVQLAKFQKPDWVPIRGPVVLLRIEPDYNFSPDAIFRPDIPLNEMYETLVFFRDSKISAQQIALKRDSVRMMKSMYLDPPPPSSFSYSRSTTPSGSTFSISYPPKPIKNFSHYSGSGGTRTGQQVRNDADVCDNCGKNQSLLLNKLKRCQRCKAVFYCNRSCQKEAWKRHKKVCKDATDL